MTIDEPGIYTDFSEADYFADAAPLPSLTQSVAKILLDQSPLHAWHAHPRLNPDYQRDDDRKFDVGNIAHKLMLGRGKNIEVLDYNDWRTAASKDAREDAAKAGKLAVLGKHYALAERMVKAARDQLELRNLGHLFRDGSGEVVTVWDEGDIWLRQMIDWLTPDRLTFADFKTTDMNAAPHQIPRMMVNAGWPIQAAMGERGLNAIDPKNAGRRKFYFVVQETEKPYCLNVVEITEGVMTMGRKQLDMAVAIWRHCMGANRWPGYPAEIVRPEYPGWHESQVLAREIEHEGHQNERALRPSGRDGAYLGAG